MFVVETFTLCQGWQNVWSEDGEPCVYDTADEAREALAEHKQDLLSAGMDYEDTDFRIVPAVFPTDSWGEDMANLV